MNVFTQTSIDQAAIRLAYQEDSAILSDLLSNAKVRRVAIRLRC